MNRNKMTKGRVAFIIFCVALPVLNWLIFYIYVNLSSFGMAFLNKDGNFTLDNFIRFFREFTNPASSSDLALAFRNTFLTFGIMLLYYPIQVSVSYFIYKKIPFYRFYRIVFFLPLLIFSVASTLVIQQILGVEGPIAQMVQKIAGLDYTPELLADERYANTVVILQLLWSSFPGSMVIWLGTFAKIPTELLESGYMDGTTWWTELTRIIVPMVWPTIALQMVLLFSGIFNAGGNAFLLTGGGYGTQTFGSWMYNTMYYATGSNSATNAYYYMSAVGMSVSVVAIIIALIVRRITDKYFNDVEF